MIHDEKNLWDYTNFLGGNFLSKNEQLMMRPPKDRRDYQVYRQNFEDLMNEMMMRQGIDRANGEGIFKASAYCDIRDEKGNWDRTKRTTVRPEHRGCPFVFSCHHVIICDPVKPEEVHFIPMARDSAFGYFICNTCYKLLSAYKLDMNTNVCCKCGNCVGEAVSLVIARDPGRFHDYRFVK